MKLCTQLKHFSASFCGQLTDASFQTLSEHSFRMNSVSLGGCGKFTGYITPMFNWQTWLWRDYLNFVPSSKISFCLGISFWLINHLNICHKDVKTWGHWILPIAVYSQMKEWKQLLQIAELWRFYLTQKWAKLMQKLDLGFCSNITATGIIGMLSVAPKTLQHFRVKKNPSDDVFSFIEQQAAHMFYNLTIETTTWKKKENS